jgi:hypothetical protein
MSNNVNYTHFNPSNSSSSNNQYNNGEHGGYRNSNNYSLDLHGGSVINDANSAAQSANNNSSSNATVSVRTKLYVTNFPEDMDQEEMKQLFNQYGDVLECTIMWNQYAFVHFGSYGEAEKALNGIKGVQYKGCKISVQWSTSSKYQQPKQHQSKISIQQNILNLPVSSQVSNATSSNISSSNNQVQQSHISFINTNSSSSSMANANQSNTITTAVITPKILERPSTTQTQMNVQSKLKVNTNSNDSTTSLLTSIVGDNQLKAANPAPTHNSSSSSSTTSASTVTKQSSQQSNAWNTGIYFFGYFIQIKYSGYLKI